MYDVTIIGSGITGSFIAHNLAKYQLKVLVLEKDVEVGDGVTKANSAIIHSGYDPKPGTLKAKLNVLGNKMYEQVTKELNVDYKRIGSYTLAFNELEEKELRKLYQHGIENGVETYLVEKEEILKKEPNIKDTVRLGLYAPTTGILAPWDMIYALLDNALYNGVEIKTSNEVLNIDKKEDHFVVKTNQSTYKTRYVINAAGLYAEHITRMVTDNPGFKMNFTRGEYYVLDRGYDDYVHHVIYPTPTAKGKGVLIVPTIHGNVLLGPTSERIEDADSTEVTKVGLEFVKNHVNQMINNTPYKGIIRTFSGIRPKTDRLDFIIEELNDTPQFIQVAGIESPGLASAPAIAKMVEEMILNKESLETKHDYKIYPQKQVKINEKPIDEINRLIKQNPKYGTIICRCESITEGEIIDAIHSPLGIRTIDGIKRRVRPGSGRCQGGFCQPLILEILARELKVSKTDILLDKEGSNILTEETKINGGDGNE
ncbi:NAD(P)/FAD-dependent oxidoreductase [Mycoplasmatota bacterium]|nr:NAD(P)/FAD-dependent oxidoreductase [Mycoplasmatota bacterium]